MGIRELTFAFYIALETDRNDDFSGNEFESLKSFKLRIKVSFQNALFCLCNRKTD